jgi:sugar phosphate isomerase/epimerase
MLQLGILTAPFSREPVEKALDFAGSAGFDTVEIAVNPAHFNVTEMNDARLSAIQRSLEQNKLKVSSLAYYQDVTHPDSEERQKILSTLRSTIDVAAKMGVDIVCILAGKPVPGKTRMQTIEEEVPKALGPSVQYAGEKQIKLAMENWTATNIMNLAQWDRIFEVIPAPNFGLNYDPSHLAWQQIDYLGALDRFAPRIFHTHAKDTEINQERLRYIGNQERGWWRYTIPGTGMIDWGEYLGRLRSTCYKGVVSIEHEDNTYGREEGFIVGRDVLRTFIPKQ